MCNSVCPGGFLKTEFLISYAPGGILRGGFLKTFHRATQCVSIKQRDFTEGIFAHISNLSLHNIRRHFLQTHYGCLITIDNNSDKFREVKMNYTCNSVVTVDVVEPIGKIFEAVSKIFFSWRETSDVFKFKFAALFIFLP